MVGVGLTSTFTRSSHWYHRATLANLNEKGSVRDRKSQWSVAQQLVDISEQSW
jgi:hypothetical protein